jgi:hypothetical protein
MVRHVIRVGAALGIRLRALFVQDGVAALHPGPLGTFCLTAGACCPTLLAHLCGEQQEQGDQALDEQGGQ